ncbi:MAG: hypothetical protein ACD_61C00071G0006 [uncultured bacterium]|nr:MAG: hypothetical protein ACD_61C00071G0006 [uncultured bacterium]
MTKKKWWILVFIFVLALMVRFYAFRESIYFGFDQARDAYLSQEIYLKHDIKLIGPPVSGDVGLFHGPLFWYLVGPVYLIFKGDPAMVSAVFRVLNALGVFLVFGIGSSLFTPFAGYLAAVFYAVSFEESQYAMYVGNPSLGVLSILLIFSGATLIYKKSKYAKWSPILMLGGAALSTQMNLMFVYTFFMVAALLLVLRKQTSTISKKMWFAGVGVAGAILSSFLLVELKYGFRSFKLAYSLFTKGYGVMDSHASKYILFISKFLRMFRDNIIGVDAYILVGLVAIFVSIWLLYHAQKKVSFRILAIWVFGWVFLMFLGGHTAYYTNAGLGVAVIIALAVLIERIGSQNKWLGIFFATFIVFGNLNLIRFQSPNSLIQEIITQPMMRLSDEYKMIDKMYEVVGGRGFTVRITGVPYSIPTVWAYLFHFYGLKKYGYLPYWETGNILGFPGEMPVPTNGTTCFRFLGREPMRGLPQVLVDYDEGRERPFSTVVNMDSIGEFTLETRWVVNLRCHNRRP